ncbi:hypothetical protein ACERK3_01105 [Phycisphaerales bacterium AB-hyl4]|uniref:Uncharacterized protein n=1 Tax=Natronomicrosphaera hydrolytica TaxID=3242702 RepID=A0ABV4TZV7_9BACT
MPEFEVIGYGRETGRLRKRRYSATDEEHAIHRAGDDGTVVESVKKLPERPATDAQKAYATRLGISFDENIGMDRISELITSEETRELREKAKTYGLEVPDGWAYEPFSDYIQDFECARTWVYSVTRHLAKASWARYRDVPVDPNVVRRIALTLMQHADLMNYIYDAPEGSTDDAYFDELHHLEIDWGDEWYFFGRKAGGPSPTSKAYRFVAEFDV